jgi:hypothetical protein
MSIFNDLQCLAIYHLFANRFSAGDFPPFNRLLAILLFVSHSKTFLSHAQLQTQKTNLEPKQVHSLSPFKP